MDRCKRSSQIQPRAPWESDEVSLRVPRVGPLLAHVPRNAAISAPSGTSSPTHGYTIDFTDQIVVFWEKNRVKTSCDLSTVSVSVVDFNIG